MIDQMNEAEGISIGFRKDAKDLSTGNGLPVAVYICKKRNPNLVILFKLIIISFSLHVSLFISIGARRFWRKQHE